MFLNDPIDQVVLEQCLFELPPAGSLLVRNEARALATHGVKQTNGAVPQALLLAHP